MNPLISVVIPCFNDGIYLNETIEKLSLQTYQNIEIIIVNDGSTDKHTLDVLEVLSTHQNIRVLHKENGRMSSARNYGVKHANGTIIAALDADDYFAPSFFEKALQVLEKEPSTGVVTSYIKYFGERKGNAKPRGGNAFNFLFSSQCPACAIVRKEVWDSVGGYDENMKNGYEDWEFYIRVTQQKWQVHVIAAYLLFYRQTKKSTHNNYTIPNRQALIDYILDKHKDWYVNCLKELVMNKQVLYTESRISFQDIWKMLKNRLLKKYK